MDRKCCKGFEIIVADETVYVVSRLQTFRVRGKNNRQVLPSYILEGLTEKSTMSDLVSLFYLRDADGHAMEQVFELAVDGYYGGLYE